MIYDFCIIGGGIVGLATALKLLEQDSKLKVLVLEKESIPGFHQTGHNSGVIHAGIYYEPGTLKATLCREGLNETKRFCDSYKIPYNECGKLIVATNDAELARLEKLYKRAEQNGLLLEQVDGRELRKREPNISGIAALFSHETAIVDYQEICRSIAQIIKEKNATVYFNMRIDRIEEETNFVTVFSEQNNFKAKQLIACGGLQADRLAKSSGIKIDFKVVPFRGEYYQLPPEKNKIIKHLIYPAPDPNLPFLGIHLTRMIDGSVTVGPSAVLGFSREGYKAFSFNSRDAVDFLSYGGFWKLIFRYRAHALHEIRMSIDKKLYLRECQKYCPSLELSDLLPYRAGIRAQIIRGNGELVHDFVFMQTDRMLHVCNAPSPAATSGLPIGRFIADQALEKFL